MLGSLRSRVGVLALTATIGFGLVGLAAPAGAAAKPDCKGGGWSTWVRADHTPFKNQGDCVSYTNHGGVLTPPKSAAQTVCESLGGTFGNTDLTHYGAFSSLFWTCNGVPVSVSAFPAAAEALSPVCGALDPHAGLVGLKTNDDPANFTCGIRE